MNYEIRKGSFSTDFTWELKDEWNELRMRELALSSTKMDAQYGHGFIYNVKPDMKVTSVNDGTHLNLKTRLEFEYRHYTGSREGTVEVHKRTVSGILEKSNNFNEIYDREIKAGFEFVKSILPEAIQRVGCYCCYGDGPDLTCNLSKDDNGNFVMTYVVNFDFDASEYR
jgi:hypothetical protein